MKNSPGFTMLEMLIVVMIMAVLTLLSSQSIQQAIKNKIKLQAQIDEVSQVRDALKVMERDINLAFHYVDLETEMKQLIIDKRKATRPTSAIPTTTQHSLDADLNEDPPDPNDPLRKPTPNRKDPTTQFVGTDQEMSFVTMNTARVSEGSQQADFVKVGYSVKTCHKPGSDNMTTKCLVRRSSPVVEGDVTQGGDDTVLLEDVSEFKLRYFGFGKQDWNTGWDSVNGDAVSQGKYPDAVEISLTVEKENGGKKKKVSMQLVVPIRYPNNPRPQDNSPGATP
jgi:prepilin-type N-terminal cleavage/methylation domain-containing protein